MDCMGFLARDAALAWTASSAWHASYSFYFIINILFDLLNLSFYLSHPFFQTRLDLTQALGVFELHLAELAIDLLDRRVVQMLLSLGLLFEHLCGLIGHI